MDKICKFVESNEIIQTKRQAFCVKTRIKNDDNTKFFINFCHSTSVSPPTISLNETELQEMIQNERLEELSQYTIPMVLERLQDCQDNQNRPAKVTHAIINRKFYDEFIKNSEIYRSFLIFVTIEVIMSKFSIVLDQGSVIVLKNKLYQLPTNQSMFQERILPFRPMEPKLVESLNQNESESIPTPMNEHLDDDDNIRIKLDIENEIVDVSVKLPSIELSPDNVEALINEDHIRIVINKQIFKDFYLSIALVSNLAQCKLSKSILSIRCPVII